MGKTKPPPTLAARVRYVRGLVQGLPMRALSKIAGLSPSMVGEIERGNKTVLEKPTAEKLARACGGSVDWLLKGDAMGAPNAEVTAARLVKEWGALPPPKRSGPKGKGAAT
jgi:transcriptional regulator with XRE-family HTH domain